MQTPVLNITREEVDLLPLRSQGQVTITEGKKLLLRRGGNKGRTQLFTNGKALGKECRVRAMQ